MGSAEAVRVPAGATVRGDVDVDGDVVVAGRIEGSLRVAGALFVETGASIVAPIHADRAVIGGTVRGDVAATGSIHLLAGSRVEGDLRAPKLVTEEGAVVRGRVELGDSRDEVQGAGLASVLGPRHAPIHVPLPDQDTVPSEGSEDRAHPTQAGGGARSNAGQAPISGQVPGGAQSGADRGTVSNQAAIRGPRAAGATGANAALSRTKPPPMPKSALMLGDRRKRIIFPKGD